jgi:hypothetical protein
VTLRSALLLAALGATATATGASPVRVSGPSPFARCQTAPAFSNAEVEPSLAADRRHPTHLVAAYQQDRYRRGGGARGIVVALSSDGGHAWRRRVLPVSRCAGDTVRQAPFASDPWVAVGPDGRIYASTVSDVVSVTTSTDWGRRWSAPVALRGPGVTDKPLLTADPRRAGTAYVVWSDYLRTNPPGTESDELVSITHDGGRTWSEPTAVMRHGRRAGPEFGQIVVDPPTGRLYLFAVWVRNGLVRPGVPGLMLLSRSDDGGVHWSKPQRFETGTTAPQRSGVVLRSSPQVPSFAVDARGVLYGVWQDGRFSNGARDQVLFVSSRDGGSHWSRPRRIGTPAAESLLPAVAAQGNGRVAVLYLEVTSGQQARYRLARSADGGSRFADSAVSTPFPLANAPELTPSPLVPGGHFLGDYMGLTGLGGQGFGAVDVVANERNQTDVFFVQKS